MKEYIVSARKYRPMTFGTVVGQSALTTTLKNAVRTGKLAHAYLFCGPRGVGKTTCARIFAKAINCQSPTEEGEACGRCESCKAFNEQRSYNIFELDAASNNSVENIKTLMEQTRIPPQVGKYKVFIIDEVHMLSTAAFNAFLKTLEEPPAHVIFILATTEKHKILPTIISRCQIYDFERMTVPDIVGHLKMVAAEEGVTCEEEALNVIAEKADGGMRDALSVFDQAASFCQGDITYKKVIEDLNVLDSDNYFKIIDLCLENKAGDVMVLLNDIINKGFDGSNLISGLAVHVRNVLMAKDQQTLPLLEVSERNAARYREQAARCPVKFLYAALRLMSQCDINYRQSGNKRLLVELTLIEIAQLTQPDDEPAASGLSPKRLKSLFQNVVKVQPATAKQVAVAEHHADSGPAVAAHGEAAGKARTDAMPGGNGSAAATTEAATPQLTPAPAAKPAAKPAEATKKRKLNGIGMTFSNLKRRNESAETAAGAEPEAPAEGAAKAFTDEELQREWLSMCNRMPQAMTGMALRMKNVRPVITSFPAVEAAIDNQVLLNDIMKIKAKIRNTLAQRLGNENITLSLRLLKPEEVTPALTSRQRFDGLRARNKAFGRLAEALGLELS